MLSLAKYFTIFIVIIVAFYCGEQFYSQVRNKYVQDPIKNHNVKISKNFEQNVWCHYETIFNRLLKKDIKKWSNDSSFKKIKKYITKIINFSGVGKLSLYTEDGELLYSSNDYNVLSLDEDVSIKNIKEIDKTVITAEVYSSLGMYSSFNQQDKFKGGYVRTIVPISTDSCSNNQINNKAIVEIYTYVDVLLENLNIFKIFITVIIVVLFLILYLVSFLLSVKSEKIISKQHEEKLELEKAKAVAESQNQAKSMFLANISHELRTPLNAIIGFSEIIKNEDMGPVGHEQYKEYAKDINNSGTHLLSLINDILDYSKAEAQKLEIQSVDIDLNKMSQSCLRLVETRASEAKVNLIKDLPDKHVILKADPKRTKQIILNLLSNSVKFTPENGSITLKVTKSQLEKKIYIIVTDTGIGIKSKDISKALSAFGQIDSSLSRRYEGTGLGLPLTKKLTEIMGGVFDIKSEEGLGTTITLSFDMYEKDAEYSDEENSELSLDLER